MTVKIVKLELILTTLTKRGNGSEADPIRRVVQLWAPDGRLLAESDPGPRHGETFAPIIEYILEVAP